MMEDYKVCTILINRVAGTLWFSRHYLTGQWDQLGDDNIHYIIYDVERFNV